MYRGCLACKYWHGDRKKGSTQFGVFGLCNCACAIIEPRLWEMESFIPNKRFKVPFDPHDMKYFTPHPDVLSCLSNKYLPPAIKREIRKEEDLKMILNNKGEIIGERLAKAKIIYFHTASNYLCEFYERRTK